MLIYSGKALTNEIAKFAAANVDRRSILHTVACSAVRLAARAGRANWLNQLHEALDRLEQQALQSWFNRDTIWGEAQWIEFSAKDGFSVIPGTEALRPSDKQIVAVEADVRRAFVHKSAQRVATDNGWNSKLAGQAKAFYAALQKAEKEHPESVPHRLVVEAEAMQHSIAVALADDKLGIARPLPKGALTDDEIEALAEREQVLIPAAHVVSDAEAKAERAPRKARAN